MIGEVENGILSGGSSFPFEVGRANPGYRIGNRMAFEWTYCDSRHESRKKRRIQQV
jgi:hypothetical protein